MTRAERIAEIINQRKPLAHRIQTAIANLEVLRDALGRIEVKRGELLQKVNEDEIQGKLESLDFRTPHDAITEQLAVLEKLQARFSRNTLNIGVVGLMGQGKSTLLQSITGLGNEVIPAKGGVGACTAVKSTIYHRPGQPTEAEIMFHSKNSLFQEVILPHYKSEELGLSPEPSDFDDFIYSSFPVYAQDDNNAWKIEMIDRLKKDYYDQSSYRSILGKPLQFVSKNEIKGYVSHFDPDNNPNNYKNLAVKEVKIFCDFDNNDVGQIALVDIPGLGDHVLGDKELMLKALGEEVDIVLFVRRPEPIRANWDTKDTELYSQAAKALNDLKSRSFMILNQVSREYNNEEICTILQSEISRRAIKVVDCFVTDCSNSEEVNSQVLDKVLDYLSTKIRDLDVKKAGLCQEKLTMICQQIQSEVEKGKNIFSQSIDDDYQETQEIFTGLFGDHDEGWWHEVSLELQKLRSELWLQRQAPDEELYEGFMKALESCHQDKGILSQEDAIAKINDQLRIVGPFKAYPNYQDELRVLISHRFLQLDQNLQRTVEAIKDKVAVILKQQGLLSVLSESSGSAFFDEISKLPTLKRFGKLKESFEIITKFQLSYRGLILPRMRQHLDGLTSITAMAGEQGGFVTQDEQTLVISVNTTAEDIFSALEIDYEKAINRLKPVLEELLCEPSEAAYAMVEEFIDNIIRQKGVQSEWRNFLGSIRGKLWPKIFGQQEQSRQIRKDWLDSSFQIEKLTDPNLFLFI